MGLAGSGNESEVVKVRMRTVVKKNFVKEDEIFKSLVKFKSSYNMHTVQIHVK